jgi:hypothetical protein
VFQPADVDRTVLVNQPPVADLRRTMHNQSRPGHGPGEGAGVGQLPFGPLHSPVVEKSGVAARAHQSSRPQPHFVSALGHMAADQPRGPRNQKQVVGSRNCRLRKLVSAQLSVVSCNATRAAQDCSQAPRTVESRLTTDHRLLTTDNCQIGPGLT